MGTKSTTLIRLALLVLVVGLALELSDAARMSWASPIYELERQTVPTRTPTPEPPTPTVQPPTPTDTPAPPPPTRPPGTATPAPTAASRTPTKTALPPKLTVNTASDVYSGPGLEYDVVGTVEAGDTAIVVGRNADSSWWQIVYQRDKAWIPDTVVTVSPGAYDVPVVNVTALGTTGATPSTLPTAGGDAWLLAGGAFLLVGGVLLLLVGRQAGRRPT